MASQEKIPSAMQDRVRKGFAIPLGIVFCAFVLSACGKRETTESLRSYPNRVTVDDKIIVKLQISVLSPDLLLASVPSSVNLQTPALSRAEVGEGFVLTLSWTFVGTSPTYWQVSQYSGTTDGFDESEMTSDKILTASGASPSVVSQLPSNRYYKLVLAAHATKPYGELGDVVFKTIMVDLRGAL